MSQNVVNYGIDPSGAQLLDELLSGEQQNRLTMDGGNSRPPYAEIGTIWTDKSVTGKATLKRFNGTFDDVLMTVDETTGAITIPGIADTNLSNLSASGEQVIKDLFSANYVTTDTAQTISGVKTIAPASTSNIHLNLKRGDLATSATTPESNKLETIYVVASDGSPVGAAQWVQNTNGSNYGYLLSTKKISGTDVTSSLRTVVESSGATYATCPTPTDTSSTSSVQIATTGWVNSTGNNVVHLSGAETITGNKTFSGTLHAKMGGTYSASPASNQNYLQLTTTDSTGKACGRIDSYTATSGETKIRLCAYLPTNISKYSILQSSVNSSEVARLDYLSTSFIPATENSTQIATTAWVNTANKTGYGIGAPNYSAAVDAVINNSTSYTATANGWIQIEVPAPYGATNVYIDGVKIGLGYTQQNVYSTYQVAVAPIAKDSTVTTNYGSNLTIKFIPCK